MQLNTNHKAFNGAHIIFGNAITNHQNSVYFRVKDIMPDGGIMDEVKGKRYLNNIEGKRWYGTTKEQLVEEKLKFLRRYVSHSEYKAIYEEALACTLVFAGLIRNSDRVYGYVVMDENGKVITTCCLVNNYKAINMFDDFIRALQQDKQRAVQNQFDHLTKRVAESIDESEKQLLQSRLDAITIELKNVNKVVFS